MLWRGQTILLFSIDNQSERSVLCKAAQLQGDGDMGSRPVTAKGEKEPVVMNWNLSRYEYIDIVWISRLEICCPIFMLLTCFDFHCMHVASQHKVLRSPVQPPS